MPLNGSETREDRSNVWNFLRLFVERNGYQYLQRMKTTTSMLLIGIGFPVLHAQVTPSQEQQIKRLLGDGFTELPAQQQYPYSSYGPGVSIEPSATRKYDTTGLFIGSEFVLFRHPIAFAPGTEGLKL